MIKIYNEDCMDTMKNKLEQKSVNIILTSPPYNTGRNSTSYKNRLHHEARYDIYTDTKTSAEYIDWSVNLFSMFDRILKKDGVILYNISYGSDATCGRDSCDLVWRTICHIIENTPFTVADRIVWKKKSALANNVSTNKLTRIVEDVFVFCRKEEYTTFQCNKGISSVSASGQKFYKNYFNLIEASNNDGVCSLNKATYSTELCDKLLTLYGKYKDVVYDPFMGTGTTAVACKRLGMDCYGSELSKEQVDYALNRLQECEYSSNSNNFTTVDLWK